jgi:hypothetical protein
MHVYQFRLGIALGIFMAALMVRAEEKPVAPAASDFVRFHEDAKGAQLQTAIVTYRNAEGVVVDLIGAIHIGDKTYYDALNKRFTAYEVLLYEMVGEDLEAIDEPTPPVRKPVLPQKTKPGTAPQTTKPGELSIEERVRAVENFLSKGEEKPRRNFAPKETPPEEAPAEQAAHDRLSWLHPLYDTLKNSLKLESQMEGIDYSKRNFVHADMTARQFAALQDQRGEGFLQMWWHAVQAQVTQPDAMPNSPGLLKILEILCRPDSPTELKRLMGRMFDQVEKIMAGMETDKGSVIVVERNKIALEVLKKEIAKGHKHLAIFYGAAHLTDMEQRLVSMGFKPEKSEWLTAWDLPPEPPPVKPGAPTVKPSVVAPAR